MLRKGWRALFALAAVLGLFAPSCTTTSDADPAPTPSSEPVGGGTLRLAAPDGVFWADEHLDPQPLPPQRAIEVTEVLTIETDSFAFATPAFGLDVLPKGGTLLARDGDRDVFTPYDDCVLIMSTRRPRRGETAVRLGRFVS